MGVHGELHSQPARPGDAVILMLKFYLFHNQSYTHVPMNIFSPDNSEDQRDWDEYVRHVESDGCRRYFLKGGWEALDPIDVATEPAVQAKFKECGRMDGGPERAWQCESQHFELGGSNAPTCHHASLEAIGTCFAVCRARTALVRGVSKDPAMTQRCTHIL
jgi:hypothetical protein